MSKTEGILVDFNSNDTFSKIKSVVEAETVEAEAVEPKAKAKRKPSTKKIIVEPIEADPVEDIEDIKPKAKAKRKPKKEIIVEDLTPEPVVEVLTPEPVVEVKKNIKTIEQVDCPKCDRPMTKTTLRYHHDKSCPGEKINREDIPVKKELLQIRFLKLLSLN